MAKKTVKAKKFKVSKVKEPKTLKLSSKTKAQGSFKSPRVPKVGSSGRGKKSAYMAYV